MFTIRELFQLCKFIKIMIIGFWFLQIGLYEDYVTNK